MITVCGPGQGRIRWSADCLHGANLNPGKRNFQTKQVNDVNGLERTEG